MSSIFAAEILDYISYHEFCLSEDFNILKGFKNYMISLFEKFNNQKNYGIVHFLMFELTKLQYTLPKIGRKNDVKALSENVMKFACVRYLLSQYDEHLSASYINIELYIDAIKNLICEGGVFYNVSFKKALLLTLRNVVRTETIVLYDITVIILIAIGEIVNNQSIEYPISFHIGDYESRRIGYQIISNLARMNLDVRMSSDMKTIVEDEVLWNPSLFVNHEFETGLYNCDTYEDEKLVIVDAIKKMHAFRKMQSCNNLSEIHDQVVPQGESGVDYHYPKYTPENIRRIAKGLEPEHPLYVRELIEMRKEPLSERKIKAVLDLIAHKRRLSEEERYKQLLSSEPAESELRSFNSLVTEYATLKLQDGKPESGTFFKLGHQLDQDILDRVDNVTNSVDRLTSVIATIVGRTSEGQVDDIIGATNNTADALKSIPQALKEGKSIFSQIEEYLSKNLPKNIVRHVFGSSSVVIFVAASVHFIYERDLTSMALAIGAGICVMKYSNIWDFEGLWENVQKFWAWLTTTPSEEAQKPQAIDSFDKEDLVNSLLTLASCYSIKTEKPGNKLKHGLRTLSSYRSMKSSLQDIVDLVMKGIELSLNWFRANVLVVPELPISYCGIEAVDTFLNSTKEITKKIHEHDFSYTVDNYAKLQSVYDLGCKIQSTYGTVLKNKDLMAYMVNQNFIIKKLLDEFKNSNFEVASLKKEPQIAVIIGGAGCGKSALSVPLSQSFVVRTQENPVIDKMIECPTSVMYSRQFEHIYWDGYDAFWSKVIIMDDAFQTVEDKTNPDGEPMSIIRIGGLYPFIGHAAKIEEKGKLAVNVDLMVCTTNVEYIYSETIKCQAALHRRCQYVYKMIAKDEYVSEETKGLHHMERKIDINKCPPQENGIRVITPYCSRYHGWNVPEQKFTGEVLEYDELVDKMVHDYWKRKDYHETFMKTVDDIRDEQLQKRRREEYIRQFEEYEFNERKSWKDPFEIYYEYLEDDKPQMGFDIDMDDLDDLPDNDHNDVGGKVEFLYSNIAGVNKIVNEVKETLSDKNEDEDLKAKLEKRLKFVSYLVERLTRSHGKYFTSINKFYDLSMCVARFGKEFVHMLLNEEDEMHFEEYIGHLAESRKDFTIKQLPKMIIVNDYFQEAESWHHYWEHFKIQCQASYHGFVLPALNYALDILKDLIKNKWFWVGAFSAIAYKAFGKLWKNFNRQYNSRMAIFSQNTARSYVDRLIADPDKVWDILGEIADQELLDAVLNGLWLYNRDWWRNRFDSLSPESVSMDVIMKKKKEEKKVQYPHPSVLKAAGKPQGNFTNLDQEIENVIDKNSVLIYSEDKIGSNDFRLIGRGVIYKGLICLVPYHFMCLLFSFKSKLGEENYKELKIKFQAVNLRDKRDRYVICKYGDLLNKFACTALLEHDFCLLELPASFQPCRSIDGMLMNEEDHFKMPSRFEAILVKCNAKSSWGEKVVVDTYASASGEKQHDDYIIGRCYRYNSITKEGDCGSLLFVKNHQSQWKLIGMHTLGGSKNSISSAIFKNKIITDMSELSPMSGVALPKDLDTIPQSGLVMCDGQFIDWGELPYTIHQPTESKIKKSELYECWGAAKTAPAILKDPIVDGKRVDILEKALNNYCTPNVFIDSADIEAVCCSMRDSLYRRSHPPKYTTALSFRIAVEGMSTNEFFSAISKSTSVGIPKTQEEKWKDGKKILLNSEGHYDFECRAMKDLEDEVISFINLLKLYVRSLVLFQDNKKDERRKWKKILALATRAFSGSPIVYLIAFRMMFGSFCLWMNENGNRNNFLIGVNPYTQWHEVAMDLLKFGGDEPNMDDADYSIFDGSQKPEVHWGILENVILPFFTDDDNNEVRKMLWWELVNAFHVKGNHLYQWVSSLPSGHPFTIYINCLYGEFNLRYTWLKIHQNYACLVHFDDNIIFKILGDDLLYAVSKAYREFFNSKVLQKTLSGIGMNMTAADKGEITGKFKKIEEVTLLKRSFRKCPILGKWVGPLDIDVILEIPYWTKKVSFEDQIVEQNVEVSIRELTLHGEDNFNKWVPVISRELFKRYGVWPKNTCFISKYLEVQEIEMWY